MLSQWKTPSSPRPKNARQVRSNVKKMLISVFDSECLVHHEFLPQRQTMNQDCLHNRSATPSRCSSSETASQMVFRYLASAPRQCAMPRGPECQGIVRQAQHPRGSPLASLTRLAPCDFFLFPRQKSTLKGKRLKDIAEIQLNTTRQLQAIPRQACQTFIEKWNDRWNRCIQSAGSYFEGDNFE
jgi:hypothetical protein